MSRFIYKLIYLIFLLLTLPVISIVFSQPVYASPCNSIGIPPSTTDPSPIPEGAKQVQITFTNIADGTYRLRFATIPLSQYDIFTDPATAVSGKVTLIIKDDFRNLVKGDHDANLEVMDAANNWGPYCENVKYKVGYDEQTCVMTALPKNPTNQEQIRLDVTYSPAGKLDVLLQTNTLPVDIKKIGEITVDNNGVGTTTIGPISPPISNVILKLSQQDKWRGSDVGFCKINDFTVKAAGAATTPRPILSVAPPTPPPPTLAANKCDPKDPSYNPKQCTKGGGETCDTNGNRGPGIKTAIGCIHTNPAEFVKDLLKWVIGIGGGIAFLMMLLGAFQMLTSSGNPETLQAGRDRLTSAVIGLLFIIFAVLLLQIIGADILGIPEFK